LMKGGDEQRCSLGNANLANLRESTRIILVPDKTIL